MEKSFKLLFFLLVVNSFCGLAQKPLVQYDLEELTKLKILLKSGNADDKIKKEYRGLLKKADGYLDVENPTIINKNILPPTANKNDYLSISRYWWPDETKADGLPWIRKDGETNPDTQTDAVDRKRLGRMSGYIESLSLAYFFSEEEKYAKKAVRIIETWFLDKKTRMNPHLQFAQSVPGNPKSRRSGILDGRDIPVKVLDGVTLLSTSKNWSSDNKKDFDRWLFDYEIWLTLSPLGLKGAAQENNHGSWYNYQAAALAYYNENTGLLKKVLERTRELFDIQQDAKGAQTHELKRTRSYFYSCFNLDALTRIAMVAEKAEMPMWNYASDDSGKGILKAVDFLLPAANGEDWAYKTTKKGLELAYLMPVLKRIMSKVENPKYEATYKVLYDKFLDKEKKTSKEKKIYKDASFINQGLY